VYQAEQVKLVLEPSYTVLALSLYSDS
jgi:hypothetical protein